MSVVGALLALFTLLPATAQVRWQDDFSNPANWAMSNTSSPPLDWVIGTALPPNLTSQSFAAALASTSGGNFAYIDSDATPGGTQNALLTLVNPVDLSGAFDVHLRFQNYHRRYLESHAVEVSIDAGASWTIFPVNTSYPINTTSPNPETVLLNISAVADNQPSVLLRFRYQGAWDWFWAIDDVELVSIPNVAPSGISLSSTTVLRSAGLNALVGTLSSTDTNLGDVHTYSLAAGSGDANNALFSIVGNELRINDASALMGGVYSVRIRSTDSGNEWTEQAFSITVTDDLASISLTPPGSISESQLIELQGSTSALPDGTGISIEIVDLDTATLVTGLVTTVSANSFSVTAGPLPAGLYEVRAFAGPDIVDVQQLVVSASQVPVPPGVHAVPGPGALALAILSCAISLVGAGSVRRRQR